MNQTAALVLKIVTAIVLIAAVMFGVYYGVSYFSDSNKMAEELEIGNQYMEAEEYQAAIDAYDQALEYEPENEEVKSAIAHAYVMLAGTYGETDEAVEAYQKALLYNIENKNAYWGVANIYEGREDDENVIAALETGYENTQDENMKIKLDNIEAERAAA
ncbi:MAG TPA: tetratricopeptide repeat protein, partial [Lachnospiraceae bacterium]|nr:tetratricopeptide repeat protein [Lachnospiraceae bacterium]